MLELMGLAFVVILCCAFAGGALGVFRMREHLQEASVIGVLQKSLESVQPAVLQSSPQTDWYHPLEAECLCDEFEKLGAQSVGRFVLPEIDAICLHAFVMQDPPAFVTVNNHPQYGCWSDMVMLPEAGGSVTLTTVAPQGNPAPRPAQHVLEKLHVSTHPVSMRGFACGQLLNQNFHNVDKEQFADVFNLIMADCQKALANQDIDQALLESIVEDSGIVLNGDEAEAINAERQQLRHQDTLRQCMESYASTSGLSAIEWESQRDEIFVVYDQLPQHLLLEMLQERLSLDEDLEDNFAEMENPEAPTRLLAREFIASLPGAMDVEQVATLNEPVLADVYRIVPDLEFERKAA